MPFYEMLIEPCGADGWEFEAVESDGEPWGDVDDLIQAMAAGVAPAHLVDVRECIACGADDIRGRVRDEPSRIFAVVRKGYETETYYLGIVCKYD
jgi:hypothetical protein